VTLAEQHRRRQLAIRAVTLRQILAIWPAFDLTDIDRSWAAVQQSLTAVVWLRHRDSANLAAAYYQAARLAAAAGGSSVPVLASAPPLEQLDRSLGYVGRIVPKNLIAAGRKDVAAQTLVHVSGAVSRLVLNGGRDTIAGSIKADPQARGWQRITSSKPCAFCEMLAGRGAIYSKDSVDFAAHDHCACGIAPSWTENPTRDVRDYAPSARNITPEQRQTRNERVRDWIAANG
jgi:hypothetical protein